jgi:hypothetical protein
MQTVVTQASSQRQTVSSRQESITASKVTKAFSSSSTITKTTRVASGHVPKTPQHSVDVELESIPPPKEPERKNSLVHGTSNANFKKKSVKSTAVQAVVVTSVKSEQTTSLQTTSLQTISLQTIKPKSEFGVQIPHKSPLPERSTKLKEVPIPKVPTAAPASVSAASAAASTTSAAKVASPTTEASTEPKPAESKLIRLGK